MDISELYAKIVGVVAPWEIQDIELDESAGDRGRVTVTVGYVKPQGAALGGHIHGYVQRRWRHLDSCQFETRIVARVPRIKKPDGTTVELEVPWAERFSRITRLMEAHVISVLHNAKSHTAAAEILRMSRGALDRVMARAVERGMARREAECVPTVGLDEKAMRRGHRYVTVLSDIQGGRVLDLVEGRDQQSALKAWEVLTPAQRDSVEAVAMDMWPAYMNSARIMTPEADTVHDRFHVASHLGKAVDTVRKGEHRELLAAGDATLTGTKYAWLRRFDDLRSASAAPIRELRAKPLETAKAWGYKEWFDDFWSYLSRSWAEKFFARWYRSVIHTKLEAMKKVARMLKRHLDGLLAYAKHRITNAVAEGLNSKIQTIRSDARGLPSFRTFRIRVLFHCGKLNLKPG